MFSPVVPIIDKYSLVLYSLLDCLIDSDQDIPPPAGTLQKKRYSSREKGLFQATLVFK
jgi:hypothetical protein